MIELQKIPKPYIAWQTKISSIIINQFTTTSANITKSKSTDVSQHFKIKAIEPNDIELGDNTRIFEKVWY